MITAEIIRDVNQRKRRQIFEKEKISEQQRERGETELGRWRGELHSERSFPENDGLSV
jgi:hypothetical protein